MRKKIMCGVSGCLCKESCPSMRACSSHQVKARRCLHKNCGKRFVPECGAQVFCGDECRIDAGFDDTSLLNTIQKYLAAESKKKTRRKEQVKRAKRTFYHTEKGRQAKSAENKRHYAKNREFRQQAKQAVPESASYSVSIIN